MSKKKVVDAWIPLPPYKEKKSWVDDEYKNAFGDIVIGGDFKNLYVRVEKVKAHQQSVAKILKKIVFMFDMNDRSKQEILRLVELLEGK